MGPERQPAVSRSTTTKQTSRRRVGHRWEGSRDDIREGGTTARPNERPGAGVGVGLVHAAARFTTSALSAAISSLQRRTLSCVILRSSSVICPRKRKPSLVL